MNYLSAENLSKSYGDTLLFEGLNFGLRKGEKTALIASNGSGKSTLLKILTGLEAPDSGSVTLRDGIHIAILEQDPDFPHDSTIDELIQSAHGEVSAAIQNYETALQQHGPGSEAQLENATLEMERLSAWDYDRRLKQLLSLFRIQDTTQKIGILSGGEKKRLALAMVLLDEPDLLVLDEPTNHLDVDMIEWLENYLSRANGTLLMVTHDRYFLDRVCNRILEMDSGNLYYHEGNYEYFLRKKEERELTLTTETNKARQLMKKELEWLRRMPKARTHKSKSRIQAFDGIREKAMQNLTGPDLKLQVKPNRLGGKILEIDHLEKNFGTTKIVKGFSYIFKKGERIGIIGRNGSGKTSFLNLLTGALPPDSGSIEVGQTVEFGYYKQSGVQIVQEQTVIEAVKEIAEVVRMGDGSVISASRFLEHFMFPAATQYKQVSKLSGGEKRRLNLLMVLIKNPNFLILDEPTNDLDILALNRLEEFLLNYQGCLVLVSHDRYFLDKLTDHLLIFEGNGKIRDYYGMYSKYSLEKQQEQEEAQRKSKKATPANKATPDRGNKNPKSSLSFNEKREYGLLEKEIESLEHEKAALESRIANGELPYEELNTVSIQIGELIELIDEKTLRWMELDERRG